MTSTTFATIADANAAGWLSADDLRRFAAPLDGAGVCDKSGPRYYGYRYAIEAPDGQTLAKSTTIRFTDEISASGSPGCYCEMFHAPDLDGFVEFPGVKLARRVRSMDAEAASSSIDAAEADLAGLRSWAEKHPNRGSDRDIRSRIYGMERALAAALAARDDADICPFRFASLRAPDMRASEVLRGFERVAAQFQG